MNDCKRIDQLITVALKGCVSRPTRTVKGLAIDKKCLFPPTIRRKKVGRNVNLKNSNVCFMHLLCCLGVGRAGKCFW